MLFRFSLYGFLKNQRYFEPFLVLVFLEKGMSYFEIGTLIAFREACVNLMGVPTGAIADTCGRRISMILSFAAYIVSFVIFAYSTVPAILFVAMLFFAIGESFRDGTHKALIFSWLRLQDRLGERTKVYGYTRSWSLIGSAVSVILSAVFVFVSDGYRYVFLFAIPPYLLNIINFFGYPKELDAHIDEKASVRNVARHLRDAIVHSVRKPDLRRLMLESMGFEGVFKAVKDYLQPVLKAAAGGLFAASGLAIVQSEEGWSDTQRSAVLVGVVYFVLYVLSSFGSRQTHKIAERLGNEERASTALWASAALLYGLILLGGWMGLAAILIPAFVLLHVMQAIWRPLIISRFDKSSDERQAATILSIEGQAQGLATLACAPIVGLAIDFATAGKVAGPFWPIGLLGLLVAGCFVIRPASSPKGEHDLAAQVAGTTDRT
ncbi:MAG: hypothetical protein HONBIEJF_01557 [Fimbriimonadaceae bacterium]|nr:hypothetical protein [Fimbriimonadaceae bacterium]